MRNITRVAGAWWVRFFQGTKVLAQGYFSDRKCGGYETALRKAKRYRNSAEIELAPIRSEVRLRTRPAPNKKSGCPAGISASIRVDKRRGTKSLRFSVAYRKHDTGTITNKVFETNLDYLDMPTWKHMAASAQACRDDLVWCRTHGKPFNPLKYKEWRTEQLHPFVPPVRARK